jgi:endonuclease YncB( thermonuclease family)
VARSKQDRYGRSVGVVTLAGMDIHLAQVKRGLAWHDKQYQNEQSPEDREAYAQSESQARDKRIGLWRDPAPIETSVFRQEK